MGVRISELPRTQSAGHSDNLVINHNGATSRITVEDLMESYLSDAGFLSESDLADYLGSHLSSYLYRRLNGKQVLNKVREANPHQTHYRRTGRTLGGYRMQFAPLFQFGLSDNESCQDAGRGDQHTAS